MLKKTLVLAGCGAIAATVSLQTMAKVSAEEAAKLGKELTPVGAEKAGNGGEIPEWTGGITEPPAGVGKNDRLTSPYDDASTGEITPANMAEKEANLSEGHKTLLKRYPTYKMKIYPAHRSAAYPQAIYDATIANATTATLTGSDKLENAKLGYPFPIPGAGAEVIVNHKVRYRGDAVTRSNDQVIVYASGRTEKVQVIEKALFVYGNIGDPGDLAKENMVLMYLSEIISPPKSAGEFTLVHEPADQVADPRKAWIASKGSPRARRAPSVAYDNPSKGTDGHQFNDQVDMFNGAMDRYTWKLEGKKEIYIPYNSYDTSSDAHKYETLLPEKHMNQDIPRYELHRVWVVTAELKPGISHQFAKRVFYVDEDSWSIALVENYDKQGGLWRFQEGHMATQYFIGATSTSPEVHYDFANGDYFVTALTNEGKVNIYDEEAGHKKKDFTTSALKRALK